MPWTCMDRGGAAGVHWQYMQRTIVVTGATGNTGQVVASELQRLGVPFVAMARSAASRAALAARGIASVHGDFDDPASLEPALTGARTAYLVCTPDERLVARETAFIRAARAAGLAHIVKCSALTADERGPSQIFRSHGTIDRALIESGIDYTIVRPTGFMQIYTLFAWDMIDSAGVISNPSGDGGVPLIDVRDVARVVVKAPTEPGHHGKIYDLTGPESLDGYRTAELVAHVLARPISFLPAAPGPFAVMMRLLGVPPVPREHLIQVMRLTREHRLEQVHDTLAQLGIEATPYEQFLRDLIAGRTGSSSFEPPSGVMFGLVKTVVPGLLRLRLRLFGRPPARGPRRDATRDG